MLVELFVEGERSFVKSSIWNLTSNLKSSSAKRAFNNFKPCNCNSYSGAFVHSNPTCADIPIESLQENFHAVYFNKDFTFVLYSLQQFSVRIIHRCQRL